MLKDSEKHPLIVLAEAHQVKLKTQQLLDEDHDMSRQVFVMLDCNPPRIVKPIWWIGDYGDMKIEAKTPEGRMDVIKRSDARPLLVRLLDEKEKMVLQEYIPRNFLT